MNNGVLKAVKKEEKNLKKYNVLSENVELPKVKVNKKALALQESISDELIEIGGNEFYCVAINQLKTVIRLLKKVDLNNPNKQNLLSRFFEIDLAADYVSYTHDLYNQLETLSYMSPSIEQLVKDIDLYIQEASDKIKGLDGEINSINKSIFISQIKTMENYKMNFIILRNSYQLLMNNPEIQKYMFYWRKFRNKYRFPRKNRFNDNAYLLEEYEDRLVVDGKKYFEFYNDISRTIRVIRKYSTRSTRYFDLHVGMQYNILRFDVYEKGKIDMMISLIDDLIKEFEQKNDMNLDSTRKYHALLAIKEEFIKLKFEIQKMIDDPKIAMHAKKAGVDFDVMSLMTKK